MSFWEGVNEISIAKNIKSRREEFGLSQAELAEKADVTQSAVSRWEHGESVPLLKYQKKLAILFGCSVDELNSKR